MKVKVKVQVLQICAGSLTNSTACKYRQQRTVIDMVDMCPLPKLAGGLQPHHNVNDDALKWLETTVTTALPK